MPPLDDIHRPMLAGWAHAALKNLSFNAVEFDRLSGLVGHEVGLEIAFWPGAATLELSKLSLPPLDHADLANWASHERFTIYGVDLDRPSFAEFDQESRWAGEAGVDADLPLCPGEGDIEQAPLLAHGKRVGSRHGDL